MRFLAAAVISATVLCAFCLAQNTPAPPANTSQIPAPNAPAAPPNTVTSHIARIAAGSVIPVQLTKTIDAKKAKTGDPVEAKVIQDMKSTNGEVLVPRDTKITGHVVEAQARSKDQKESQLAIVFDHAGIKNGPEMQMPMSIQAIIAPPGMNNPNNGGDNAAAPSPGLSPGGNMPGGGRAPGMSGSSAPMNNPPNTPNNNNEGNQTNNSRPPITGNTQGVIGISNLSLSVPGNGSQGSLVTSDKGNVKLESGTLMLLRVGQ